MNKKYMTKKSFREASTLKKIWNKIIIWNNLKLATVMWHSKEWKIVKTLDFDSITTREENDLVLFEVHTQEELWQYIKNNNLHIIKIAC